jgi:hypothetical protein
LRDGLLQQVSQVMLTERAADQMLVDALCDGGLFLSVAVDDNVVRITLERRTGVLPVHPPIEGVVHEQIGEQRRDRGSL